MANLRSAMINSRSLQDGGAARSEARTRAAGRAERGRLIR